MYPEIFSAWQAGELPDEAAPRSLIQACKKASLQPGSLAISLEKQKESNAEQ